MARDYGAEIDSLKREVEKINAMLGNKPSEASATATCSFCGKSSDQVEAVIAGPSVNICNECVEVFEDVIKNVSIDASLHKFGGEIVVCSFCTKSSKDVHVILGGPEVHICDECVQICRDIIPVSNTELPPLNMVNYSGFYTTEEEGSKWSNTVRIENLFSLVENKTALQVLQGIGNGDRLSLLIAILRKPMNVAAMVEKCGFNTTGQAYHHLKPLIAADLVQEKEKGVYCAVPYRVQGIIMILAGISDLVDNKYTQGDWSQMAVVYENLESQR